MAAVTPSTVKQFSAGNFRLLKLTFDATTDNADTYTNTSLKGVLGYWAQKTTAPTQGKEGIDVAYVASTGVFTFYMGEDNMGFDLYVMQRA